VQGAKVLAASLIDLFVEEGLLGRVKAAFREETGGTEYFSVIPPDQLPRWS